MFGGTNMINPVLGRPVVLTILAVVLSLPLPAGAGAFLQLGNIKGEATDRDHVDWIDILAVSESISSSVNIGSIGGGAGAGKVQFGPLQLVKQLDISSVELRSNLAAGTRFDDAVIEFTNTGADKIRVYFRYELKNVYISSVSLSASGNDVPTESFSLVFGSIKWIYTPDGKDGSAKPPVDAGWDISTGKPL